MAWFGKRDEKKVSLPDLPEGEITNSLRPSEFPRKLEVPDLPPLPNEDYDELSNQQMIKEVLDSDSIQKSSFDIIPHTDSNLSLKPLTAVPANLILKKTKSFEIPPIRVSEVKTEVDQNAKKSDSVFVRLDKFESSIEILEDIKKKIIDIEKVLERTREIREKEEKEIEEWEREVQIVKSRLDSIDRNLFEKFD